MKKTRLRIWMVLFMVAGLVLAMAQSAAANALSMPLPPTKAPNSARFDLSGFVKSSDGKGMDLNAQLSGSGAISGQDLQTDVSVSFDLPKTPGTPPILSGPISVTTSIIVANGKSYIKLSGLGSEEDKWYETDTDLSSSAGMLGGASGATGLDPSLDGAYTVTQVGKENVGGAPTTKYRIDVDYQKLASMSGLAPMPGGVDVASDLKYVLFIWVGDNDMYLHKVMLTAGGTTTVSDVTTKLDMEINLTFRDFDTPITITAPPNAEKLDISALGAGAGLPLPAGGMLGMPVSVNAGIEMGMPRTGDNMAGMPRTGRNNGEGVPFVPIAVAVFGLFCVVVGGAARRASVAVRHTEHN